jgi:hypothetical protein
MITICDDAALHGAAGGINAAPMMRMGLELDRRHQKREKTQRFGAARNQRRPGASWASACSSYTREHMVNVITMVDDRYRGSRSLHRRCAAARTAPAPRWRKRGVMTHIYHALLRARHGRTYRARRT